MDTHVVIMAGGVGSRLWPVSTQDRPKQFLDILGVGKTMIQMTYERFLPICNPGNFWVVTSRSYVGLVHEQLPDIPLDNILAEPAARNTAPCIAYACWKIGSKVEDADIVVTPADSLVVDGVEFRRVIGEALRFTGSSDAIVTVGITVTRPETGYGYIRTSSDGSNSSEVLKTDCFKEKPDAATAMEYFRCGNYLWNAGIFVWRLKTIVDSIRRFAPQIAGVADAMAAEGFSTDAVDTLFPTCDKISIDYAVMEKSSRVYTIPGSFGWSDVGTWGAVRTYSSLDCDGNSVNGSNVRLHECKDCVVHVDGLQKVEIQGLNNCIVAFRGGRLLICSLDEEQRIREFSDGV